MAKSDPVRARRGAKAHDRYFDLVREFPLRPLQSDEDLTRAIEIVNSLIDRDELGSGEADYLEVLGDLVEKYETEHHPMPPVSDADMLRHLIEARGITQAEVAAQAGIAVSTISEILTGKRGLNRRHIEALARYFHVSPAVFIGD